MQLPGRNFSRFLLVSFMLFSLVMRTAYQGKQFQFMQNEMRRPDVKTIDEMIESNFTLYVYEIREFRNMEFIER